MLNFIDETEKIKEKWYWLNNRVLYAQLLDRLVNTHGLKLFEAIDILFIANSISVDEHSRASGHS